MDNRIITGCIGEKLGHSFSKEIHNLIGDYDYRIIEIPPEKLTAFMQEKAFGAINVTIPYKQAVIPFLDEIDGAAKAIGAVNTIVNRGGRLCGYNTDFYGMTALIKRTGVELAGAKVLIPGTGGTSKTARAVAASLGAAQIITVSRSGREGAVTYDDAYQLHGDADVIINTTPCGMFPNIYAHPVELDRFPLLKGVIDAVYNPLRSELVSAARQRGIKASGGLYMLVAQAVKAYEYFFDTAADGGLTQRVFARMQADKENIVLTGMPGSGKTTLGNLLSRATGREFADTDELIKAKAGMEISEIFSSFGEERFREIESKVIREISSRPAMIISTGGGAVLRDDNIRNLKMNGRIYFLDRDPSSIVPTADRPLALDREAIEKRYKERYGRYTGTADEIIKIISSPDETAKEIERRHYDENSRS